MAAGGDQRVDQRVAVGEVVLARRWPAVGAARRAAPSRSPACRARPRCRRARAWWGSDESTIAVRCSSRRRACAQPRMAHRQRARAGRSARGPARSAAPRCRPRRRRRRSGSLKETGTPTMRPSNSGMATCMAASSGVRPASARRPARAARRRAQRLDDRARRAPRAPRAAASPAASPRRRRAAGGQHRGDERVDAPVEQLERGHAPVGVRAQRVRPHAQRVGRRRRSIAAASASTNAVLPVTRCER